MQLQRDKKAALTAEQWRRAVREILLAVRNIGDQTRGSDH
jgi:hypothetical protein